MRPFKLFSHLRKRKRLVLAIFVISLVALPILDQRLLNTPTVIARSQNHQFPLHGLESLGSLPKTFAASSTNLSSSNTRIGVNPTAIIDLRFQLTDVAFTLNITNAPPINSFGVILSYNFTVLHASSLDYSGNILTQIPNGSQFPTHFCLDGVPGSGGQGECTVGDSPGITDFTDTSLGPALTQNNSSGTLFTVHFKPITPGFSQIAIKSGSIYNGTSAKLAVSTVGGYYTSIDCPRGSGNPCKPSFPDFAWSPTIPTVGALVVFDGSLTRPVQGTTITDYSWSFEDFGLNSFFDGQLNSTSAHQFLSIGTFPVTLSVRDSNDITTSITHQVRVIVPLAGDFHITAFPNFLTIHRNGQFYDPAAFATSTITVTSINGSSGTITLEGTANGNLGELFQPTTFVLSPNSSVNATLIVDGSGAAAGTYQVTVTGRSGGSVSRSVILTVLVVTPPPDFQLRIIGPSSNILLAGGETVEGVEIVENNTIFFNGTVTLTGQVSPSIAGGPILSFQPDQISLRSFDQSFSTLIISTTTLTLPGNYTITIIGTSGTLVHSVNQLLTVLPSPVLALTPSSGKVGTLVSVHGTGFQFMLPSYIPVQIEMTFDDQLLGVFTLQGTSFNFSFDVPLSQTGILHQIHAKQLAPFGLDVQTSFQVLPEPGVLDVSVSSGTIYFPGDIATIFVETTLDGQPTRVGSLQAVLVFPNGSNIILNTTLLSPGFYRATVTIPTRGSLGTYSVTVRAHQGAVSGSSSTSFLVKPTWLQANGHNLITAGGLVGALSMLGVAGAAWRRGYFSRKNEESSFS